MIDWTKSMKQTYEFYKVDPHTWKDDKLIETIVADSCTITRDKSQATLGSARIDTTEVLNDVYIRTYLCVNQNGITERVPLGTHLVQTPSKKFDGMVSSVTLDAYTPLIELKENCPPIGFSVFKDTPIMETAESICKENTRAPVVGTTNDSKLYSDFVAEPDESYLTYVSNLISNAKHSLTLDELGRVMFEPDQDVAALQPVWKFDDGNSSILYPSITEESDLYNVPNVVEVIYSTGGGYLYSKVVNDDPNSPISTVNRGREVKYRDTNPSFSGEPNQDMIDQYARELLKAKSTLQHTVSYKHGYCPVRIGDCVILDYRSAGINNVKAQVLSQNITCKTGCEVDETAVYTEKLWG
jgi:hypothetical protein